MPDDNNMQITTPDADVSTFTFSEAPSFEDVAFVEDEEETKKKKESVEDEPQESTVKDDSSSDDEEEPTSDDTVTEDTIDKDLEEAGLTATKEEEETTTEEEEPTTEEPVIEKTPRDYSQFDEDLVPKLKKLRNHEFNAIKDDLLKYQELRKTQGKLPPNYYEHPEAYALDPNYKSLITTYQKTDFETNHYLTELEKIENFDQYSDDEKKVSVITGYDQNGQPQYQEMAYEPRMKYQLQNMVSQGQSDKRKLAEQAQQIQQQHGQRNQEIMKTLSESVDQFFSKLSKEIQPQDAHTDKFKKSIPEPVRNHPVTDFAAGLFSVVLRQGAELKKLKKATKAKATSTAEQRKTGPTPSKQQKTTPSKDNDVIDFEELDREFSNFAG